MIRAKLIGMCEGCNQLDVDDVYVNVHSNDIEIMCDHQSVCQMWYERLKEADRKHHIDFVNSELSLTRRLHGALETLNESTPKSDG